MIHRITYEQIDDNGIVTAKQEWSTTAEGSATFNEHRTVKLTYKIGGDYDGAWCGPTTLQIDAVLDPTVRWKPLASGGIDQ